MEPRFLSPVLNGRTAELSALMSILDRALAGRGQAVLVAGEAGIGKSRLAAEMSARAANLGFTILQGSCFEHDRSLPYGPLQDMLRSHFPQLTEQQLAEELGPAASELLALVPELHVQLPGFVALPTLDPEQDRRRLLHALGQYLLDREPVLLVIEDIHWSDRTTLDFLVHFARALPGRAAVLLLTYRSDEAAPELEQFVAELDRRRLTSEIRLGPLDGEQIEAMLQAILGRDRPVRRDLLETVTRFAEGNPFFIEEVLPSLLQSGATLELRIPRSVEDAVRRRIELLSGPARQTLLLAAVIGQRVDFAVLQDVSRASERELLEHLKELVGRQLVIEESAERFAFRHALTRAAIYGDLLARERRLLHEQILESIQHVYSTSLDAHVHELASHAREAQAWPSLLEYAALAGQQALRMHSPGEAVEHFSSAMQATAALGQRIAAWSVEKGSTTAS
jgi:predicted ATPase